MGCCFGKSDHQLPSAFDPVIGLSTQLKGAGCKVDGLVISGSGSVCGDSPVLQDKAYFEVTLRKAGVFAVGVATRETGLDSVLSQEKASTAWTLTSSSSMLAENETIGVAFDQGDYPVQLCACRTARRARAHGLARLRYSSYRTAVCSHPLRLAEAVLTLAHCMHCADFYKDGKLVHQLSGIRGEVLPVFSVADGAMLQPNFGGSAYAYTMPMGFQGIIKSMSLL